jgi:hypothetical protein
MTSTRKQSFAQAQPRDIKTLHRWIAVILAFPGLSPITVKVAVAIAMHLNLRAGRCDARYETIARETDADRRSVIRAVVALEAAGLIMVERSRGRHVNHFVLLIPNGDTQMSLFDGLEETANGDIPDPATVTYAVTPNELRREQRSKKGKNIYRPPSSGAGGKRETGKEESRAKGARMMHAKRGRFSTVSPASTAGRPKSGGAARLKSEGISASKSRSADPGAKGLDQIDTPADGVGNTDVTAFLAAFPRRGAIDATRTAFRAAVARGNDPATLVAAAKRYAVQRAADVAEDARQEFYTLGPVRWLDEDRWKDEVCTTGVQTIDQLGNVVAFHRIDANPRWKPRQSFSEAIAARQAAEAGHVQH